MLSSLWGLELDAATQEEVIRPVRESLDVVVCYLCFTCWTSVRPVNAGLDKTPNFAHNGSNEDHALQILRRTIRRVPGAK